MRPRLTPHDPRSALRRALRAGQDRPGRRTEPFLSGSALQRHGHARPAALAEMRGVKAEGGWGVVCTEEVEFHWANDISPFVEGRLVDDADIPAHALMVERVHAHGALAGCELVHTHASENLEVRTAPMAVAGLPVPGTAPVQAREMTQRDIDQLRRWHRRGSTGSIRAGYDLVYVYAGHALTMLQAFLSRRFNTRQDAYGGSLECRARLLRESVGGHDGGGRWPRRGGVQALCGRTRGP